MKSLLAAGLTTTGTGIVERTVGLTGERARIAAASITARAETKKLAE